MDENWARYLNKLKEIEFFKKTVELEPKIVKHKRKEKIPLANKLYYD